MTSRLFLDFDGTLIDPRRRLYELFCELAPENTFTYSEYWAHKRNKVDQRTMLKTYLHYSDDQAADFHRRWMSKIEEPDRLTMDVAFPGVPEFLHRMRSSAQLYLVTARQHPELVTEQLEALGWGDMFDDVLVTRQLKSKDELVSERMTVTRNDVFVGDTGEDIQAGRRLGLVTVGVSSGFLCAAVLETYRPDRLLTSVVELADDRHIIGG